MENDGRFRRQTRRCQDAEAGAQAPVSRGVPAPTASWAAQAPAAAALAKARVVANGDHCRDPAGIE